MTKNKIKNALIEDGDRKKKKGDVVAYSQYLFQTENASGLVLQGDLFFASISRFKEILNPNRYKTDEVFLDVSQANLFDHSALEALDAQTSKFKEAGKTLNLKNVQPEALKIIEKSKTVYHINVTN